MTAKMVPRALDLVEDEEAEAEEEAVVEEEDLDVVAMDEAEAADITMVTITVIITDRTMVLMATHHLHRRTRSRRF